MADCDGDLTVHVLMTQQSARFASSTNLQRLVQISVLTAALDNRHYTIRSKNIRQRGCRNNRCAEFATPVPVSLQQARHVLAVAEVVAAPERLHPHALCAWHIAKRRTRARASEARYCILCLCQAGAALSEHLRREDCGFSRIARGADVLNVLQVMRHAEERERRCARVLLTAVDVRSRAEQAA